MVSGTIIAQLGHCRSLELGLSASPLQCPHTHLPPCSPQAILITAASTEKSSYSLLKPYQFLFILLKAKILIKATAHIHYLSSPSVPVTHSILTNHKASYCPTRQAHPCLKSFAFPIPAA